MASYVKVSGKRLCNEIVSDSSFQIGNEKRAKFDNGVSTQSDQLSDQESNIDISSYNTPPPSTISESRDRSISPGESIDKEKKEDEAENSHDQDSSTDTRSGPSTRDQEESISNKSDRLLQDDVNYIALCSACSVLRSQREMVKKDIIKLRDLKQKALQNPQKFIQELGSNEGEIVNSIPKQIHIINGDLNKLFKRRS